MNSTEKPENAQNGDGSAAPEHVSSLADAAAQSTTAERVSQRMIHVESDRKRALLVELFEEEKMDKAIVFTRTKRGADRVVLTSDNPRDEDPLAIIAAMRAGLQHEGAVAVQPDRAEAIALALAQAAPEDVVLIAGKGHEDYQEVRGQRRAFSDQAEARRALAQRGAAAGPAA